MSVIWRGRWLVLTGLLAGVAVATFVTRTSSKVFRATTLVQVQGQAARGTGELFGLLGPNGAGKSTTLRVLIGQRQPTAGRVRVAGYDVVRQWAAVKPIFGYVPDRENHFEDFTGRKNLEIELRRKVEELAVADRRKNEFLATLSHELRNPLAPIRAAVETLRRLRAREDPAFDDYFDEATRTVLDEVHRISNIVTEFTRFARLPAPRLGARARTCKASHVRICLMSEAFGLPRRFTRSQPNP